MFPDFEWSDFRDPYMRVQNNLIFLQVQGAAVSKEKNVTSNEEKDNIKSFGIESNEKSLEKLKKNENENSKNTRNAKDEEKLPKEINKEETKAAESVPHPTQDETEKPKSAPVATEPELKSVKPVSTKAKEKGWFSKQSRSRK